MTQTILLNTGAQALANDFALRKAPVISGFRVGSVSNFVPAVTDTDVDGFVYQGPASMIGINVISVNEVEIDIELDASVGNFAVGNFVILVDDDIPLCKSVNDQAFSKLRSDEDDEGNSLIVTCVLKYTGVGAIINLVVRAPDYAQLPVLRDEDSLAADPGAAQFTQYVLNTHTALHRPVMVLRHASTNRWHGNPFFQPMDHPYFGCIFGGESGDGYQLSDKPRVDGNRYLLTSKVIRTIDGGSYEVDPVGNEYDGGAY